VTMAPELPRPRRGTPKWTRDLRAQATFKDGIHLKDGPDFVFEIFIKHGWNNDGQLMLLVK